MARQLHRRYLCELRCLVGHAVVRAGQSQFRDQPDGWEWARHEVHLRCAGQRFLTHRRRRDGEGAHDELRARRSVVAELHDTHCRAVGRTSGGGPLDDDELERQRDRADDGGERLSVAGGLAAHELHLDPHVRRPPQDDRDGWTANGRGRRDVHRLLRRRRCHRDASRAGQADHRCCRLDAQLRRLRRLRSRAPGGGSERDRRDLAHGRPWPSDQQHEPAGEWGSERGDGVHAHVHLRWPRPARRDDPAAGQPEPLRVRGRHQSLDRHHPARPPGKRGGASPPNAERGRRQGEGRGSGVQHGSRADLRLVDDEAARELRLRRPQPAGSDPAPGAVGSAGAVQLRRRRQARGRAGREPHGAQYDVRL